jgi:hypothetical protein
LARLIRLKKQQLPNFSHCTMILQPAPRMRQTSASHAAADFGNQPLYIDHTVFFPRRSLGTALVKEKPIARTFAAPWVQRRADRQRCRSDEAPTRGLSGCGFFIG